MSKRSGTYCALCRVSRVELRRGIRGAQAERPATKPPSFATLFPSPIFALMPMLGSGGRVACPARFPRGSRLAGGKGISEERG
jgi:hypothetical protein